MSNAQLAFIEQRRSTRIDRAIPITVYGANLSQEPYQELVSTLTVSYHGCRYRTKYELVAWRRCIPGSESARNRRVRIH